MATAESTDVHSPSMAESMQICQQIEKIRLDVKCPQIPLQELTFNHGRRRDVFLGGGGFAKVWKAKCKGMDVVMKVIDRHRFTRDQKHMILACKEARAMCQVEHQSILKIFGIMMDDDTETYGLVLEYMEHGSLKEFSKKVDIPSGLQVEMMMDISSALKYLHSSNPKLIHADIKLDNIMVNQKFQAKLGDFGVSFLQGYTSDVTGKSYEKGTVTHMAPELFEPEIAGRHMAKNSCETDVYSFGVTLFELMTKTTPFPAELDKWAVIYRTVKGIKASCELTLQGLQDSVPGVFIKLTLQCLELKPEDRVTFQEIAEELHKEYILNIIRVVVLTMWVR